MIKRIISSISNLHESSVKWYNRHMKFLITFLGYMKWHYGKALMTTFAFWKNILIFLFNFFSIKSLSGNFFTPWKRLADNYPKNFDLKIYIFTFLVNSIMRTVGVILRSIIIFIGLAFCIIYIILLPVTLLVWLVLPLIIVFLIGSGLVLIIFS